MRSSSVLLALLFFFLVLPAGSPAEEPGGEDENYDEEHNYLPGEEVLTESGKKLKIWSTEGPVPVSRAPEPFEDREKTVIRDSHVIIDAAQVIEQRQETEKKGVGRETHRKDSFDVRDTEKSDTLKK